MLSWIEFSVDVALLEPVELVVVVFWTAFAETSEASVSNESDQIYVDSIARQLEKVKNVKENISNKQIKNLKLRIKTSTWVIYSNMW